MKKFLALALATAALVGPLAPAAMAQQPLRVTITDGVIEPLPIAVPTFEAETGAAGEMAQQIARLVVQDLVNTGLFREVPASSYISNHTSFSQAVAYPDWRAINVQGLVTGAVAVNGNQLNVKFRLHDIFSGQELGDGLQFGGSTGGWRRMAHKVADAVYARITGEGGYFDSRVVFVSESGPKDNRQKRLAIMDYDGANTQYLTDSSSLVLAPRFSPTGDRILYTSYASGTPRINLLDVASVSARQVPTEAGDMAFSPRFSPNGSGIIYSVSQGGNTDIFAGGLGGGASRLTNTPSIETSPSYSPDGRQVVFESDRSGSSQLYVMSASGGEAKRISFGDGRYGTPVWSPRGDMIAFTKQSGGRFSIGVMRTDGSEERLLTSSFLDEGPTWAPNGRVLMFTRETQGASGGASIWMVDIAGRNIRQVATGGMASDPSWGPLQP